MVFKFNGKCYKATIDFCSALHVVCCILVLFAAATFRRPTSIQRETSKWKSQTLISALAIFTLAGRARNNHTLRPFDGRIYKRKYCHRMSLEVLSMHNTTINRSKARAKQKCCWLTDSCLHCADPRHCRAFHAIFFFLYFVCRFFGGPFVARALSNETFTLWKVCARNDDCVFVATRITTIYCIKLIRHTCMKGDCSHVCTKQLLLAYCERCGVSLCDVA